MYMIDYVVWLILARSIFHSWGLESVCFPSSRVQVLEVLRPDFDFGMGENLFVSQNWRSMCGREVEQWKGALREDQGGRHVNIAHALTLLALNPRTCKPSRLVARDNAT